MSRTLHVFLKEAFHRIGVAVVDSRQVKAPLNQELQWCHTFTIFRLKTIVDINQENLLLATRTKLLGIRTGSRFLEEHRISYLK